MKLPPGFTSRPATLGDLDGVAALVTGWELTYTGESEAARAMLQYEWAAASFDMERDTRVIHAADGALAAFAQHSTPDPELLRYDAFGPVDPSFEGRGLGSSIVEWTETETRSRIGQGSTARLWNSVQAGNAGAIALLETHGYAAIRTFWEMTMDLDGSFEAGAVARGRDDPTDRDGGGRPGRAIGVEHGVPVALRPRGGDVRGVAERSRKPTTRGIPPWDCSPSSTGRSSASATTG